MIIKHIFHLFIFGLLLASCSNSGKEYFTDKENGFKILFPGKPTSSDRTINFPFGSFTGKKYTLETTAGFNTSYSVTCIELPANLVHSDSMNLLPQLFALTQADYVRQFGEGGLSNTWVRNINKYPGREFVWSDMQSSNCYTRRVFYVKNKLYFLEVAYSSANQHKAQNNSFLNSFQLLSKEINPNPEPVPAIPFKKFNISFPGTTITRRQVIMGAKGPLYLVVEMHQPNTPNKLDEFGNFGYGVNYTDFGNDSIVNSSKEIQKEFIYDNSVNNAMIQNGGEVISYTESTVDGIWCIEMKALALHGQIEMHTKTFFKDHYLYQIMVLSSPDKSENEAANKFMESFHHY